MSNDSDANGATTVFSAICNDLAVTALGVAGISSPKIALDMAKAVTRLIKGLVEKLDKIEEKIVKIQEGPFKTGLLFLENAKAATEDNHRIKHIEQAAMSFMHAAGQLDGPLAARAHFYAGACYDLLNEKAVALQNYRTSFEIAIAVGTPITERPPHRSVRAGFPHTAPTSGV